MPSGWNSTPTPPTVATPATCTTTRWQANLGTLDTSTNTVFDLTDALGSVLASFSNVASSAAIKGNQVFGPYGNFRDHQGTINTTKGFT